MAKNLLQKLKDWRAKQARRDQVELFRVISNQAVEEIAAKKPQNKKETLEILVILLTDCITQNGCIRGFTDGHHQRNVKTRNFYNECIHRFFR